MYHPPTVNVNVSQCALHTHHYPAESSPLGERRVKAPLWAGGPTPLGPKLKEIKLCSPVPSAPAACLLSGSGDRCG